APAPGRALGLPPARGRGARSPAFGAPGLGVDGAPPHRRAVALRHRPARLPAARDGSRLGDVAGPPRRVPLRGTGPPLVARRDPSGGRPPQARGGPGGRVHRPDGDPEPLARPSPPAPRALKGGT